MLKFLPLVGLVFFLSLFLISQVILNIFFREELRKQTMNFRSYSYYLAIFCLSFFLMGALSIQLYSFSYLLQPWLYFSMLVFLIIYTAMFWFLIKAKYITSIKVYDTYAPRYRLHLVVPRFKKVFLKILFFTLPLVLLSVSLISLLVVAVLIDKQSSY